MPRYVVRFPTADGERYLVWSTIVDAPLTCAGTLDEIQDWWKAEYGRTGLESLQRDIAAGLPLLEDEVCGNRAGKDETELTYEQLVEYVMVRASDTPKPVGTVERCDDCGEVITGAHGHCGGVPGGFGADD